MESFYNISLFMQNVKVDLPCSFTWMLRGVTFSFLWCKFWFALTESRQGILVISAILSTSFPPLLWSNSQASHITQISNKIKRNYKLHKDLLSRHKRYVLKMSFCQLANGNLSQAGRENFWTIFGQKGEAHFVQTHFLFEKLLKL